MASHAPEDSANSFPQFAKFPTELQVQVWDYSLPNLGSALYPFKERCWLGPEHGDLAPVFAHEMLDPARIDVSSALVNEVSLDTACKWAAQRGVEVRNLPEIGQPATGTLSFIRRFEPELDILYLPMDIWRSAYDEPDAIMDAMTEEERENYWPPSCHCPVRHIAVPEEWLRSLGNEPEEILQALRSLGDDINEYPNTYRRFLQHLAEFYEEVKGFYVVMDPQPNFIPSPHSEVAWRRQIRWGWKKAWNQDKTDWDEPQINGDTQTVNDQRLLKLLDLAGDDLRYAPGHDGYEHDFEIGVVYAEAMQ